MLILGMAAVGCGDDDDGDSASAADKIDAAWAKWSETTAAHSEFDMEIEVDGDLSDMGDEFADLVPLVIGLSGSADFDASDTEDIKADIELELDIEELLNSIVDSSLGEELGTDDAAGIAMIGSMVSDIKLRIVDQTLYMQLVGSWYEMPLDESGLEDLAGGVAPVDLSAAENADLECFQDNVTVSKVLKDIEDEGSEDVGDTETTHITASLDTNALIDLIVEVNEQCGTEEMSDSDIAEARDILEGMLTKADIELWIDEDDNIRKMSFDIEVDMAAASEAAGSVMDDTTTDSLESLIVKITMTMENSNFGDSFDVEVPSGAMPIEDLLGSLGGLSGSSDDSTDDSGLSEEELQDLEDFENEMDQLEEETETSTNPTETSTNPFES
jgi:hypothetical protein